MAARPRALRSVIALERRGRCRWAAQDQFGDRLSRERLNELVRSELIGNAVVHGRGATVLHLQFDGETVRGEVIDQGGGFEHDVRMSGPDHIGGLV